MQELMQGLVLMVAGMGIVFLFLMLLIFVSKHTCAFVARFNGIFPADAPPFVDLIHNAVIADVVVSRHGTTLPPDEGLIALPRSGRAECDPILSRCYHKQLSVDYTTSIITFQVSALLNLLAFFKNRAEPHK